jgi:hypothetical protein
MSMLRYISFFREILPDRCAAVRVDHGATRVLQPGDPALLTTPWGSSRFRLAFSARLRPNATQPDDDRVTPARSSISRAVQPRLDGQWGPTAFGSGGLRVDDAIQEALLGVVNPGAIAAATAAAKEVGKWRDQVRDALSRDLEAARRAAADLVNRLVTAELETRWNGACTCATRLEGWKGSLLLAPGAQRSCRGSC